MQDKKKRVNMYLLEEQIEGLDEMKKKTGSSRSELVRRAISKAYGIDGLNNNKQ